MNILPQTGHQRWLTAVRLAALLAVVALTACGSPPAQSPPAAEGYRRILSLAPSITETLFALGLGERVVGVTRFCNWPPEAREKTRVGGFLDPNYELIATLRPDLVLLLPEHQQIEANLKGLGLTCRVVRNRSLEEILGTIRTIGELGGAAARADSLADSLKARIAAVRERSAGDNRPGVLLAIGRSIGSESVADVHVAGGGTIYHELIELAGGRNVMADSKIDFPVLSAEGLLHLDPEVIVELVPEVAEQETIRARARAEWNALPTLAAVRTGRVYLFIGDWTVVPGPRIVRLLEELAGALHPGAEGSAP